MAPINRIITSDQVRRRKAPTPSKATPKQTKVPQRLFLFDVTPPPTTGASQAAAVPSKGDSQQKSAAASAWPFPVVLPGAPTSTDLPAPITSSEPQGLGYEYGPEIFVDSADYWEDATPSNPSFRPKVHDKEKSKKKKSKTSSRNGYHGAKKGEKMVQVKYSNQRKQWTTNTKEFLDGGGVKRIWITYIMDVEVEEERPVDKDGNVVEDADSDAGDENLGSRPRAGETNIDVDWSSDESDSTTSDSSESDDDKKAKKMKAAKKAVKKTAVKTKIKKHASDTEDSSDNKTKKANKKTKDKVKVKKSGSEKHKPAGSKDKVQGVPSEGVEAKAKDQPAASANSEPTEKENDKTN